MCKANKCDRLQFGETGSAYLEKQVVQSGDRSGQPPLKSEGIIKGLSTEELGTLLKAVERSEANKREILRLARIANAGYSGKGSINLSQGNITDVRWTTSAEALSRLLDLKAS